MNNLRLVVSRPSASPDGSKRQADHPCLQLFSDEFDYLIRSLRRLGVSRDDVEDVAHEVFLVLYQSWSKYDPTRPFRPYLFAIAFRVACNHGRKRRKEVPFAFLEVDDVREGPDQRIEAEQRRAVVLQALETIAMPKRAVLIMHDIDGLGMSEIAEALSIYRFTGYSRLHKARKEFASAVLALSKEGAL
jgi:RNA polymerase sigma-70 factor (ECF subfamily)